MKILVAVDGSKSSLNAVKYAAKLALGLRTKDRITLVSVHDDSGLRHAKRFVAKEKIDDFLREISDEDLKAARAHLSRQGVAYDAIIRRGHVAEQIIKLANGGKFDIVVLGSKGRTGLVDLLLGSVAQKVTAACKPPVVVVK